MVSYNSVRRNRGCDCWPGWPPPRRPPPAHPHRSRFPLNAKVLSWRSVSSVSVPFHINDRQVIRVKNGLHILEKVCRPVLVIIGIEAGALVKILIRPQRTVSRRADRDRNGLRRTRHSAGAFRIIRPGRRKFLPALVADPEDSPVLSPFCPPLPELVSACALRALSFPERDAGIHGNTDDTGHTEAAARPRPDQKHLSAPFPAPPRHDRLTPAHAAQVLLFLFSSALRRYRNGVLFSARPRSFFTPLFSCFRKNPY